MKAKSSRRLWPSRHVSYNKLAKLLERLGQEGQRVDPLYGHDDSKKIINNPNMRETIKELALLDGAFVVSESSNVRLVIDGDIVTEILPELWLLQRVRSSIDEARVDKINEENVAVISQKRKKYH